MRSVVWKRVRPGGVALVFAALAAFAGPARPALALDVSGVWELTSRDRRSVEVMTLTLVQDGDVLRGTGLVTSGRAAVADSDEDRVVVEGRIGRDGDVVLVLRRESGSDVIIERLTGRVYRREVSGIIGAGGGGRLFHGHRVEGEPGALPAGS